MSLLRVGVIFGGKSSEKEVSLNSGRNVLDNLDKSKYIGIPIFMDYTSKLWILPWNLVYQNTTIDIYELLKKLNLKPLFYENLKKTIDFAFISLYGKYGEDGCIQSLFELLDIPYTGSDIVSSAIGMDKFIQQKILAAEGIDVPKSILIKYNWKAESEQYLKLLIKNFSFPFVIKPRREGSSIGVSIVSDLVQIKQSIKNALKWDNSILVEEYLRGIEFSSIIIEKKGYLKILGITEINSKDNFFSYEEKYMPGKCRKFTPPRHIEVKDLKKIENNVIKTFKVLGFRGYARIDGFFTIDKRLLITDPNTFSGMTPSSFFFEQAAHSGYLPSMIISELIELSLELNNK